MTFYRCGRAKDNKFLERYALELEIEVIPRPLFLDRTCPLILCNGMNMHFCLCLWIGRLTGDERWYSGYCNMQVPHLCG